MTTLLWVVVPYVCMVTFVAGLLWRRRYGRSGWTTRSTQLYERATLRWASPLFHYGILAVLLGHIGGLLVPASWTRAGGLDDHAYHLVAVTAGSVTGLAATVGLGALLVRRRRVRPVYLATTRNDKAMYAMLTGVVLLGMVATLSSAAAAAGPDYRQSVAPWLRSLFGPHPDPNLMTAVPLDLRLHVLAAWVLLGAWPFTRLAHALSAPIGYLTRPYVVYRRRVSS